MSLGATRLVSFEGLPGTGKTTAARALQRSLREHGVAAAWWREEDPHHPATPKALRRTAAAPGFPARCVAHWRRFVGERAGVHEIAILDGSAFQSTIRFMLEQGLPRGEILAYVSDFERAVAPLAPRLVHLEPKDPRAFLSGFVYPERGAAWVTKVSAYLAATPCCRARGWSGPEGMLEFWLLYHELCEVTLARLGFPLLRLATGPGCWTRAEDEVARWLGLSRPPSRGPGSSRS